MIEWKETYVKKHVVGHYSLKLNTVCKIDLVGAL